MFSGMKMPKGFLVALGIIIRSVVGSLTNNAGIWIAIGVIVGAAVEFTMAKKRSNG